MKDVLKRILNPDTPLRERLFQLLSTIAIAEFAVVSVYTIVSGGSVGHIVLMLVGTALFAGTVALTFKTGAMRVGTTVSGLLYFFMYPLTFFSSGGMYGGAPVVFAFALVYVFLVTRQWERVASLAVCIAGAGACYALSYLHPELLDKHTLLEEHVESFLSIMLVVLLICALFAFVTRVYNTENRIVQQQKKKIEDMNRAQKRFFSSMSHEIRTPVNAIIGLNEMTLREPISDEVRENSENIEVASRNLLHTVNEILDMSKLETGGMEIVRMDYRTTALLSGIVNMTWSLAHEKGLEFKVNADPSLPSTLHGDEARIRQILLNVITNAIKYTKAGSVTLTVSGKRDDSDAFWAVYDVVDTGIGIRQEDIPHLFTAFQRVDEQQTHSIEGTGLGLSIVKQLLDMMGGTVKVESEYGVGSRFSVKIPQEVVDDTPIGIVDLRKPESAAKEASSAADASLSGGFVKGRGAGEQVAGRRATGEQYAGTQPEGAEGRTEAVPSQAASAVEQPKRAAYQAPGVRILAVDDTPMNLMVVKKLLRDTKAIVDTAASGAEALEKTAEAHYDLIFMDHQMPEMDGVECLHRIREQEGGKCRESKVVCLTAHAGAEMEQRYLQEGFDGYLTKPVRAITLEQELARLIPVETPMPGETPAPGAALYTTSTAK